MKSISDYIRGRSETIHIPTFKSKKDITVFFSKYLRSVSDNETSVNLFSKVKDRNCYITFDRETGFSDYLIININDSNQSPRGLRMRPNKSLRDDQKLFFKLVSNEMDSILMSNRDKEKLVSDFKSFLDVDIKLPIDTENEMIGIINNCISAFYRLGADWKLIR